MPGDKREPQNKCDHVLKEARRWREADGTVYVKYECKLGCGYSETISN